jgi:hypothetical protein
MYASWTSFASFPEVLNCRRGRWPAWRARRAVALDACIAGIILKWQTEARGYMRPRIKEKRREEND